MATFHHDIFISFIAWTIPSLNVFDGIMIFGPSLGYIPQYYEIAHTKNTHAFSILVSFILLIANILRIFFWAYERFDVVLVLQSVVMIMAQMILLELIVRLRVEWRRKEAVDETGLSLTNIKSFGDGTVMGSM